MNGEGIVLVHKINIIYDIFLLFFYTLFENTFDYINKKHIFSLHWLFV